MQIPNSKHFIIYLFSMFALIFAPSFPFALSSSLSKDRHLPRELLNTTKKDPEFRSIFQHIQSTQLRRSPSELFAQHIVSIVHYIKGTVCLQRHVRAKVWANWWAPTIHYLHISGLSALVLCVFGIIPFCGLSAAQHFHSSDMTLSERFAMYQRKAAEAEMMKPRKSPEIHR